jgi:hypothetical protein
MRNNLCEPVCQPACVSGICVRPNVCQEEARNLSPASFAFDDAKNIIGLIALVAGCTLLIVTAVSYKCFKKEKGDGNDSLDNSESFEDNDDEDLEDYEQEMDIEGDDTKV